jgi:hypothetical protein
MELAYCLQTLSTNDRSDKRGPNFSLFIRPKKELQNEEGKSPEIRRILAHLPLPGPAPEKKAAEIKSKIKWKSQK